MLQCHEGEVKGQMVVPQAYQGVGWGLGEETNACSSNCILTCVGVPCGGGGGTNVCSPSC